MSLDVSRTRTFAKVPVAVTEVSFGAAPIGNRFSAMSEDFAQALIGHAWESGVRYFDTAPMYGNGLSEHRLGHFLLQHERNGFVLSTKVGRTLHPAARGSFEAWPWVEPPPMRAEFDYSRDAAKRQVHESLHRIMTNRIDIAFLHDVDSFIHGADYEDRMVESLEGAVPAMIAMREEGVIRAVGAALNEASALRRIVEQSDIDCLLVAGRYTLLDHSLAKEFMTTCSERGIAVIAGGVFNTGILASDSGRFNYGEPSAEIVVEVDRIKRRCAEFSVSLAAAAIQFAAAHPAVVSVCLGASSVAQQQQNFISAAEVIPADFWTALRADGVIQDWAPTPA